MLRQQVADDKQAHQRSIQLVCRVSDKAPLMLHLSQGLMKLPALQPDCLWQQLLKLLQACCYQKLALWMVAASSGLYSCQARPCVLSRSVWRAGRCGSAQAATSRLQRVRSMWAMCADESSRHAHAQHSTRTFLMDFVFAPSPAGMVAAQKMYCRLHRGAACTLLSR